VTRARARVLLVTLVPLLALVGVPLLPASGQILVPSDRQVFLIRVPDLSFEQLLSVPEFADLARAGGAALLSYQGRLPLHPPHRASSRGIVDQMEYVAGGPGQLGAIGEAVKDRVLRFGAANVLVVVVSLTPSPAMIAAKDDLHPVVVAEGTPTALFRGDGSLRSLASDSTRRTGVVTDADVSATISDFLGEPGRGGGSVLRVADAEPPFELHTRYLAMRRMWIPVQVAAAIYVTLAGLAAVALLALRRRVPAWAGHAMAWVPLTAPTLGVALLAAGHLPTLSYATVVPFVVGVALVATSASVPLRRFGLLVPPAVIGAAVLGYFVVEAAVGWTAALTPFLGGSELDGGRFYGLPNVFIGLLMGSSLYVAARLGPRMGFLLVAAVAFFAGLPGIGANLGAAVALFAAAGLWLGLRSRGRLGWREVGLTVAVVVVGMAAVLAAHRFLTVSPTHATRFVEGPGRSLPGLGRTFVDRLLVGWRLIVRNPFALVPVLGLPTCLAVVLHPPGPIGGPLERHPEWRDAILVTLLGSIVAYVANDSGPAAAGLGFGLALGGLLYVSLSGQTWKMGAP